MLVHDRCSRQSGINQSSVLRILHAHKMHPYHLYLHQELYEPDFQNWVQFAEWFLQVSVNESFLENVLFTVDLIGVEIKFRKFSISYNVYCEIL